MQDDLQKAYSAYQQALYLLPNPKVLYLPLPSPIVYKLIIIDPGGPKALVWNRHSLRPIWLPRPCRRGIRLGPPHVQRSVPFQPPISRTSVLMDFPSRFGIRQGERDSFPSWDNLQTTGQVPRVVGLLRPHPSQSSKSTRSCGYLVPNWACL